MNERSDGHNKGSDHIFSYQRPTEESAADEGIDTPNPGYEVPRLTLLLITAITCQATLFELFHAILS